MGSPPPNESSRIRASEGTIFRPDAASRSVVLLGALAGGVLVACDSSSGPPLVDQLDVADLPAAATVGASLNVVVEALDPLGSPIAGAVVRAQPAPESGTASPQEGVTGPDGRLRIVWTLGTAAGVQTLELETNGADHQVAVNADPEPPVDLVLVSGGDQTGLVGDPLPESVVFESRDRHGNASGGAPVHFGVDVGGGSVDPEESTTGPGGEISVVWTLGSSLGPQAIVGRIDGASQTSVEAIAEPGPAATLDVVSGNGQVGPVTSVLTDPLVVRALDRFGNTARSVVRFNAPPDNGSLSVQEAQPDPSGFVSTAWTLGTRSGPAEVVATAEPGVEARFEATVQAGAPTSLRKTSGDNQEGPATTALAQPLEVRIEDAYGNGVPGTLVTFSVSEGAGTVQPASGSTGTHGYARATFVLGPAVGSHRVSVSFAGPSGDGGASTNAVTFQASATSLPPAQVTVVAGGGQNAQVGSAVASAPAVLVSDAVGNPVPGVAVNFSASGGGSVAGASPVTGATGVATVGSWTLGTTAGQQALTASVAGLSPIVIQATAEPGPPNTVQVVGGSGQSALVGSPVATPPSVDVRDGYGNPVRGVTVDFTVTGGGGSVSGSPAITNASGRAGLSSWTLGASTGANTVSAAVTGLPPVSFSATANNPPPGFTLEIQFIGSPSASQQATVQSAAAKWNSVITGDLPNASVNLSAGACGVGHPAYSGTVDDLVVFVEFVSLDGPGGTLGSAGPCWVRGGSLLPIFGSVRMDAADVANLESAGRLYDVVLHELGHVLGVGTLWQGNGLLQGAGGSDPYFSGADAISEYLASGGAHPNPVPVENTGGGGTRDAHWRESLFTTELMTGWINFGVTNVLSRVTAASLADIGYSVNMAAAGSFAAAAPSAHPVAPPLKVVETPLGITIVVH